MEQDILINTILNQVKDNKKYRTISDDVIITEIKNYLKSNQEIIKKNKIDKQIIKDIRARLHRLYSSYQTKKKNKRNLYLEELEQAINQDKNLDEITKKLLSITISTKERLENYKEIYEKIFKITGKPRIIIDLGSGLNPLSYHFMNLNQLIYYAYEIDIEDIEFLNNYFEIIKPLGLIGKAEILDVRNLEQVSNLPYSDIVFMFKLIDLIDEKNKKTSEQLIKNLFEKNKTKFIVTSFATKTLTGRKMNLPKRKGFELMLQRINLKFETFSTNNEIFYVIWK